MTDPLVLPSFQPAAPPKATPTPVPTADSSSPPGVADLQAKVDQMLADAKASIDKELAALVGSTGQSFRSGQHGGK